MHIPDGYLSPVTDGTMFAAAAPFWYVALKKVRKTLNQRTVPVLAIFAAFSFVAMMFNVPIPGGTTAHAVGGTLLAIVLGPWAAIIGVSVALGIQALFFRRWRNPGFRRQLLQHGHRPASGGLFRLQIHLQ